MMAKYPKILRIPFKIQVSKGYSDRKYNIILAIALSIAIACALYKCNFPEPPGKPILQRRNSL